MINSFFFLYQVYEIPGTYNYEESIPLTCFFLIIHIYFNCTYIVYELSTAHCELYNL